jgi:hypothetical protein
LFLKADQKWDQKGMAMGSEFTAFEPKILVGLH